MADNTKIVFGIVASLLIGLITGAVGYIYRDSFDAPRLQIERVKYRMPRKQCGLSAQNFYRFKTAHQLQSGIDKAVRWSLPIDLQDSQIEYDHAESLIGELRIRRLQLAKELSFVTDQGKKVAEFLEEKTEKAGQNVRDVIAYLEGSKFTGMVETAKPLTQLYVNFDASPEEEAKSLKKELDAQKNKLTQEKETVDALLTELNKCYKEGRPAPKPIFGTDLAEIPNVEFVLMVSNSGRTQGSISHDFEYESLGTVEYKIKLVAQHPDYQAPLDLHEYAVIPAYEIKNLIYSADRGRNDLNVLKNFFKDMNGLGLTGRFLMTDIQGRTYKYSVTEVKPYN